MTIYEYLQDKLKDNPEALSLLDCASGLNKQIPYVGTYGKGNPVWNKLESFGLYFRAFADNDLGLGRNTGQYIEKPLDLCMIDTKSHSDEEIKPIILHHYPFLKDLQAIKLEIL